MKRKLIITLCSIIISFVLYPVFTFASEDWFPYPVEVSDIPYDMQSTKSAHQYVPLKESSENWNICVSFPHMKDNYWQAVNFGITQEIKRMRSSMRLYQAGGYENLTTQISQIEKCVNDGADGVIVGAISYDGLNALVDKLAKRGIPVIDVINGISTRNVAAKSLVSFWEMGYETGKYLMALEQNQLKDSVNIAWFPGPKDAGWVKDGNQGFIEAIKGTKLNIVTTQFGDTGFSAQAQLIEEALEKFGDTIDYIAGTGVTAEAAVRILRDKRLNSRIKIVSYYLTPKVYKKILRGQILASPTDSPVIQARIAVDQLVRILEGKKFIQHVGPQVQMVDQKNIHKFDRKSMLAPIGFQAIYSVNRDLSL